MSICKEKGLKDYTRKCKCNLSGGISSGFILFLVILYTLIFVFMSMYLLWCTGKKKKRKECGYIEELKQTQDSYSQKIPFARLVLGWGLGTSIWGGFPKKEGWPIMPNYLSKQCGLC